MKTPNNSSYGQLPAELSRPPATPPLPRISLPAIEETQLANGLTVSYLPDPRFPFVTLSMGFHAGSKFDPVELSGLAEAVAALLKEGTQTRSSQQIADELGLLGASLSASATEDYFFVNGSVLAENLDPFLSLLSDVLMHSIFPEQELELYRKNRIQELLVHRSLPSTLADERLAKLLFGVHPYARVYPLPEHIEQLQRSHLLHFRQTMLCPSNGFFVLVGALPPFEELIDKLASQFHDWDHHPSASLQATSFPEPRRQLWLVDRPNSVQAWIELGRLAINERDPNYFALTLANTILGGGASSRLFMRIREEKGYAYSVSSQLETYQLTGSLVVETQVTNEALEPALSEILSEMAKMADEGVSEEELEAVKNYLNGTFILRLETQAGLAGQILSLKLLDLPYSFLESYPERVSQVTTSQVHRVAQQYLHPDLYAIVVVGQADALESQVATFGQIQREQVRP